MSIEQAVVEKLRGLSPSQQQEVLNFVEFLTIKANKADQWQGKTAFEAAQKYAGLLEGPEDLSTNPKYMEGFGQ
jgi:hypothetical protein